MSQTRQENSSMAEMMKSMKIGGVAGASELILGHPCWTIKTRLQNGKGMTFDPRILYRGVIPNMLCAAPIAACQFGAHTLMQSFANNQYIASLAAGASAAFIACPIEMIVTHQQNSFASAYQQLVKTRGFLSIYRGLPATIVRDSIFTLALFSGKSILKPYVAIENENMAATVAGITAGVAAAAITQGVDTIKTIQQTDQISAGHAARKIYDRSGVVGFFKGGLPRAGRIGMAVMMMGKVTESLGSSKI